MIKCKIFFFFFFKSAKSNSLIIYVIPGDRAHLRSETLDRRVEEVWGEWGEGLSVCSNNIT